MSHPSAVSNPVLLITWVCIAHIFSMAGFSVFPTLLPQFSELWQLSSGEAGTVSAAIFAGYTAAVPVLVTLTDRIDPRWIYLFSAILSAIGLVGFAQFADGMWSASIFHALFGAGLGGTYMPGLKALGDHIEPRMISRATGFYTGCFSIGAAASYLFADVVYERSGWEMVYTISAIFSFLGGLIVFFVVPKSHPDQVPTPFRAMIRVFSNRSTLTWSVCYGLHSWELFAFRAWSVAFLVFVGAQIAGGAENSAMYAVLPPVTVAAIATLTGMPASILGNELCIRYGRRLTVVAVMMFGAASAVFTGGSAYLAYWIAVVAVLIYSTAIMSDSSALTAAAFANADRALRGATMAVHATIGFAGASMGPVVFGLLLDAGGREAPEGWLYGFGFLALLSFVSITLIKTLKPQSTAGDRDMGS
ncbi:MAG: MFS transporter [Hyphomicrobiales bacterium]